jgi:hypothetical protein
MYAAGRFDSAKILDYHTGSDVRMLRNMGVTHFLGRLPSSTVGRENGGRWKGVDEWFNECEQTIMRLAPFGVLDWQMDTEPNDAWPQEAAWLWRWLTEQVILRLRRSPNVPADVMLGLAPLMWSPKTWRSVEDFWIPEQRKILHMFQFICVNSYWQKPSHFNDPSFGGNVTHWHDYFFRDVDMP